MIKLRGRFSLMSDKQRSVAVLGRQTKPLHLARRSLNLGRFCLVCLGGYSFTGGVK